MIGKGILVVGFRDGKAAAPGRIVKAAHVPADGNGLLDVQLHEPLNKETEKEKKYLKTALQGFQNHYAPEHPKRLAAEKRNEELNGK